MLPSNSTTDFQGVSRKSIPFFCFRELFSALPDGSWPESEDRSVVDIDTGSITKETTIVQGKGARALRKGIWCRAVPMPRFCCSFRYFTGIHR